MCDKMGSFLSGSLKLKVELKIWHKAKTWCTTNQRKVKQVGFVLPFDDGNKV